MTFSFFFFKKCFKRTQLLNGLSILLLVLEIINIFRFLLFLQKFVFIIIVKLIFVFYVLQVIFLRSMQVYYFHLQYKFIIIISWKLWSLLLTFTYHLFEICLLLFFLLFWRLFRFTNTCLLFDNLNLSWLSLCYLPWFWHFWKNLNFFIFSRYCYICCQISLQLSWKLFFVSLLPNCSNLLPCFLFYTLVLLILWINPSPWRFIKLLHMLIFGNRSHPSSLLNSIHHHNFLLMLHIGSRCTLLELSLMMWS